jgi:hypothetical protein
MRAGGARGHRGPRGRERQTLREREREPKVVVEDDDELKCVKESVRGHRCCDVREGGIGDETRRKSQRRKGGAKTSLMTLSPITAGAEATTRNSNLVSTTRRAQAHTFRR